MGKNYKVKWSKEDQGFIATCDQFPYVSAFGTSKVAAISELLQAVLQAVEVERAHEKRHAEARAKVQEEIIQTSYMTLIKERAERDALYNTAADMAVNSVIEDRTHCELCGDELCDPKCKYGCRCICKGHDDACCPIDDDDPDFEANHESFNERLKESAIARQPKDACRVNGLEEARRKMNVKGYCPSISYDCLTCGKENIDISLLDYDEERHTLSCPTCKTVFEENWYE